MVDVPTCIELVKCMAVHIDHIKRDGPENSLDAFRRLEADNRALFALLHEQETELPLHIS